MNSENQLLDKFFVYIIRTNKNTLYTGSTIDVQKRLVLHKSGKGSKYLRSFDKINLVYCEQCTSWSEALKREAQIKKLTKIQKEQFINQSNTELVRV